jgi:hypothetical protein
MLHVMNALPVNSVHAVLNCTLLCCLQARLEEEQAALARRQASYARDRDALTPAEEEEYEHAADEAAFRIGILQRRLARHEEAALQKYYELDKKLRNDARLAVLLMPV